MKLITDPRAIIEEYQVAFSIYFERNVTVGNFIRLLFFGRASPCFLLLFFLFAFSVF